MSESSLRDKELILQKYDTIENDRVMTGKYI